MFWNPRIFDTRLLAIAFYPDYAGLQVQSAEMVHVSDADHDMVKSCPGRIPHPIFWGFLLQPWR